MHGKIINSLIVLSALAIPINVMASGTNAADFLNIGVSAYQVSLGGAGYALSNDISAGYYNPAGLSMIERSGVNFTHNMWYQDISYEYLGGAFSLNDHSTVGISTGYLHMGEIEAYDASNQSIEGISPYNFVGIVSYSYNFDGRMSLGLSGKYITEKLDDVTATGYAFDIGAQYYFEPFAVGVVANNIGPKMKYENDSFNLPASVSVGLSYSPFQLPFALTTGAKFPFDSDMSFAAGLEYTFGGFFSLRSGIGGLGSDNVASEANFGAGFNVAGIDIDYAFNPGGDLGATHFFSFTTSFGGSHEYNFSKNTHVDKKVIAPVETSKAEAVVVPAPKIEPEKVMYIVSAGTYSDERMARLHTETLADFGVKGKTAIQPDGTYKVILAETESLKKAEKVRDDMREKGLSAVLENK